MTVLILSVIALVSVSVYLLVAKNKKSTPVVSVEEPVITAHVLSQILDGEPCCEETVEEEKPKKVLVLKEKAPVMAAKENKQLAPKKEAKKPSEKKPTEKKPKKEEKAPVKKESKPKKGVANKK